MRRAISLLLLIATVLAACGTSEEKTPAACLNGPKPFLDGLADAPGQVRLAGGVAISECLVDNQSSGDLTRVGAALVTAATKLNAEARAGASGAPTVQLGYLVGAAERGARNTSGIHAELLRRLKAAALFSPAGKPPPPPFDQRYAKGYAAGREAG